MKQDKIRLTIEQLVEAYLKSKFPGLEIDWSMPLTDVGLTSFDMVTIVLETEKKFSITIPDEELSPSNFETVDSIVSTVQRILSGPS